MSDTSGGGRIPTSAQRMGDNVINACDQLASEVMHRVMRGDIEMTDQHYAAIRQHTKAVLIDWMLGDFKLKT